MNTAPRRALGAAALLLVAYAATGCTDATDSAVGTVSYTTPDEERHQLTNPGSSGCHRLRGEGAEEVENNTTADLWLYFSPDCQGRTNIERTYLPTTLTDNPAFRDQPWRSFSVVG
ncbi:hypothetical protein [Streptomyces sp. NPDC018031]|uniref:hypothetical protein n=1 Tax=Streptomyces sp. NPDC018031 TaxID=3365033 RepID=UPI0037A5E133